MQLQPGHVHPTSRAQDRHNLPCRYCRCQAAAQSESRASDVSRRNILEAGLAVLGLSSLGLRPAEALPAGRGQAAQVGTYLPPADVQDFVKFVVPPGKTPAIRAGTVDIKRPYSFALPPSWREAKVANIQSGNYCQPRCDEPWTEVVFQDELEGKATLIVSPLRRLISKSEATVKDVGSPRTVLSSVGSFITGTYLDDEDIVAMNTKDFDGRTYYLYEVNAAGGTVGPHTITSCTTKGDLLYLYVVSANDRQWSKSQNKLRALVETFRA